MAVYYIDSIKDNTDHIKKLISIVSSKDTKFAYIDIESSDLDPFTSELLLFQINVDEDIYVIHRGNTGKEFLTNLINRINETGLVCVGHNLKFDSKFIRNDTGVWLKKIYDTMIAESVLKCGIGEKASSLASLVAKYCGVIMDKESRSEFIGKTQKDTFSQQQIDYAATDVLYLKDIMSLQMKEAYETNLIPTITLEMEVIPVVAKMEYQGVTLDSVHWMKLTEESEKMLAQHAKETINLLIESINTKKFKSALEFADALNIREGNKTKKDRAALESITDPSMALQWIKDNFNVGSHKQLLTALNLAGVKTPNTNEKTLNKLDKNKIIDSVLDFREFEKQVSTYGRNIIDLIHPVTGRIHTDYWTMGTVTGRFSSSNPNMQNLPRVGGYREGFISRPGYSFISMDYSQQEYRLVAALSKEPKIIHAYMIGSDMHTATAATRFKKELKDVLSEERTFGKTMNFAIVYGTTEWGLKRNFSISLEEAKQMLKDFYDGYPRLTAFIREVHQTILKLGYSITPLGRRRYFKPSPVFATPRELEKREAQMKREGFNMIIQGGGADVTKKALVFMDNRNTFGDLFCLVLQVHDEIVVEVHDSILEKAEAFMKDCMVEAFQPLLGEIPAKVDSKISKRWGKGE